MSKRGRPRHPDILTPREWEVLALLRERLSNEEIAQRLGISLAGAKYHVSEILGKLGVASRVDAALWQPPERPWWAGAAAPMAWLWRRATVSWLWTGAAGITAILVLAGIGLLVWGLMRTDGDGEESAAASATAFVFVGGSIESISDEKLVLQDLEGHIVDIRIENAEGPGAQFCRQGTPLDLCMILSDAAPTVGEDVCVMARLLPDGELLAWLTHLDADCRFYRPTPTVSSLEDPSSSALVRDLLGCYRERPASAEGLAATRSLRGASVSIGNQNIATDQADQLLFRLRDVEPAYFGVRGTPGTRIGEPGRMAGPMIDIKLAEGELSLKYVRRGSVAPYGLLFDPALVNAWELTQLLDPPGYAQFVCAVPPEFDRLMADLGFIGNDPGDILETRLVLVAEAQRDFGLVKQIEVWREGESRREISSATLERLGISVRWSELTNPPIDEDQAEPLEPFAGEPLSVEIQFKGIDPFPEAVRPSEFIYYPEDASASGLGVLVPLTDIVIYNGRTEAGEAFYPVPELDRLLREAASREPAE